MGFSGGAQTRYKKYPCKAPCKRNSYETICENIVSRYQTLVSSLPRETTFWHRRPKAHFMTGRTGSPVTKKEVPRFCFTINGQSSLLLRPARQRCSPGTARPSQCSSKEYGVEVYSGYKILFSCGCWQVVDNHCRSHWLLACILFKSSVRHTGSI